MQESDLLTPLKPGLITFPPEKAPFETSQKRFVDPELYEMMDRPAPSDYDILGFTDMMKYDLGRHAAAVINPKLGFLTSAIRPYQKEEKIDTTNDSRSKSSVVKKERKWRNIRPPRTVKTYTYHGQPPRLPVCKITITLKTTIFLIFKIDRIHLAQFMTLLLPWPL